MKKTTGASVAKKVLCSALSAAMVVAFAPAVGNAVGSGDGTAYAAEGEQQGQLIDISVNTEEDGFYLQPSSYKIWSDHLDDVPTVKLVHYQRDESNDEISEDCYQVQTGKWFKWSSDSEGESTYRQLAEGETPQAGQTYYIAANGIEEKGYTGTVYVGIRIVDPNNLGEYNCELSNTTFWSDKAFIAPELTLTRTINGKKETLNKGVYTVDKTKLTKLSDSNSSEINIPENGLLESGNYRLVISANEGYTGNPSAWFHVRDANDLNNYNRSLSNCKFWSDKEAVIPKVTLTRYLDDDDDEGEILPESQYTVSDKWFTKTSTGSDEHEEEAYAEAILIDGKLAAGEYYIKVSKGEGDQNPLYIRVTVENAEDVGNYDFSTTYSGFWTDTAIEIPDIEAERYLGDDDWEKLDKSRYSVDRENLYIRDNDGAVEDVGGEKYSQVSMPADKKLRADDYYVKASMGQQNVFCKITVEDASDIDNYEIDEADGNVYRSPFYEGDAAAVPTITLSRIVHGKWQSIDNNGSKVFTLSKLLTYKSGVEDDDGAPTDADLEEYKKSTVNKGAYFVKMTASTGYTGERFIRIGVLDNYDLGSYDAYVDGSVWSDAIPNLSSIKVRVEKGNGDVLDPSAYKVDTSSWYHIELNDEGDEVYRKCAAPTTEEHDYRYLIKLTGNAPYEGSCYANVYINDSKDLGNYDYDAPGEVDTNATAAEAKTDLKIYREVNGKRVELAENSYTVDNKWYSYDEDAEKYEEIQDNPSSAGHYYIKVVPAEESGYTGERYIGITVGNPCANGHDIRKAEATASTCTVKGNKEYWYCENCDKMFSDAAGNNVIADEDSVELPLAPHVKDGGTTVAAATCTAGAKVEYRCTKCGKVMDTKTTAALGHSYSATWSWSGVSSATATLKCSRCSSSTTLSASISKTQVTKPTCTAKGTNRYTATVANPSGTGTFSDSKTAQDEPALGHAYGTYTVTVQPTTVSTGIATAKCTRTGCGSTVTKTVEKLESEQATSIGGVSATATISDAKPATTPNGTNVVGSVIIDKVNVASNATKLEVPETVTIKDAEYVVVGIDAKAIAGNDKLESVKLPDTIKEIPTGLFEGCSSLKEAKLPSKITQIPADTFNGTALASITIPATVTKIGDRAFKNTKLRVVELPDSVKSLGEDAFKGCDMLDRGYGFKVLRGGISRGMFDGCRSLKVIERKFIAGLSVKLLATEGPEIVDVSQAPSIGANAFRNCKSVTAIDASGAKTIGAGAFKGASKLASLKTGSKLKSIGSNALSGAKKAKTLNVKSKKLTKSGVKGALKGSSVKIVKVAVSGSKATKAKYIAKYKKIFTAKNCGKKVSVK